MERRLEELSGGVAPVAPSKAVMQRTGARCSTTGTLGRCDFVKKGENPFRPQKTLEVRFNVSSEDEPV